MATKEVQITSADRKIMRYAAYRSPQEISELMGGTLSASEVASRFQEISGSRNWITTLQRKWLLTENLYELMDTYRDWALNGSFKSAEVVFKSIKELRTMLDEDRVTIEDAMTQITSAHAERMGQAMALGFSAMMKELSVRGKDITEEEAQEVLAISLKPAFAQIDAAVQKD